MPLMMNGPKKEEKKQNKWKKQMKKTNEKNKWKTKNMHTIAYFLQSTSHIIGVTCNLFVFLRLLKTTFLSIIYNNGAI